MRPGRLELMTVLNPSLSFILAFMTFHSDLSHPAKEKNPTISLKVPSNAMAVTSGYKSLSSLLNTKPLRK